MNLKETLHLEGVPTITLRYKDREVVHYAEPNLVTMAALRNLLSMIYLSGRQSDPIATMKAGVGGCIDPEALYPRTVTSDLTSLYSQVLSVPVTYTASSTSPVVTFIADIPEDQGNGLLINEIGLFTESGNMFNIKTFPGVPKTSEFAIHVEWSITLN